jgi:hypothetical protein
MAEFDIVDLSQDDDESTGAEPNARRSRIAGQGSVNRIGTIDTATVAAELESLRQDLSSHIKADKTGLHLASLSVKLTLSAEGRVAFVAKGAAEACIEVVFSSTPGQGSAPD